MSSRFRRLEFRGMRRRSARGIRRLRHALSSAGSVIGAPLAVPILLRRHVQLRARLRRLGLMEYASEDPSLVSSIEVLESGIRVVRRTGDPQLVTFENLRWVAWVRCNHVAKFSDTLVLELCDQTRIAIAAETPGCETVCAQLERMRRFDFEGDFVEYEEVLHARG